MKKNVLFLALTAVMLFTFTSCGLERFTRRPAAETGGATALIQALNEIVYSYGDSIYADLIDFDNDGLTEVFVYISWEIAYVLGYCDQRGLFRESVDWGFYPPQLQAPEPNGDTGAAWYSLAGTGDGLYYLVYSAFTSAQPGYDRFFTVRDGEWIMALVRSMGFNFDRPGRPDDWEIYHEVNNAFVSEEEYRGAPFNELGIVEMSLFPRHENSVHDVITELTQKASD